MSRGGDISAQVSRCLFQSNQCSHQYGLGSGKIHYILRAPTLVLGLSIIGIDREGRGSLAIGFLDKVRLPSEVSVFIADCLIFGWIGSMHQYILGLVANMKCSHLKTTV